MRRGGGEARRGRRRRAAGLSAAHDGRRDGRRGLGPGRDGDLERALAAWVPDVRFDHGEGNSPAHFLSEAIGVSCLVPLANGQPALGRWQGIFLIELDGPRERTVEVRLVLGA